MLIPLPDGWELYHDEQGQVYRANRTTGHTRWSHPNREDTPQLLVPRAPVAP